MGAACELGESAVPPGGALCSQLPPGQLSGPPALRPPAGVRVPRAPGGGRRPRPAPMAGRDGQGRPVGGLAVGVPCPPGPWTGRDRVGLDRCRYPGEPTGPGPRTPRGRPAGGRAGGWSPAQLPASPQTAEPASSGRAVPCAVTAGAGPTATPSAAGVTAWTATRGPPAAKVSQLVGVTGDPVPRPRPGPGPSPRPVPTGPGGLGFPWLLKGKV